MTIEEFDVQWERLVNKWKRDMDEELQALAFEEVKSVPIDAFRWQVKTWIGSRKYINPPLLAEFTECRLEYEKKGLQKTVERARREFINAPPIADVMSKIYGVKTVSEALAIAKRRQR